MTSSLMLSRLAKPPLTVTDPVAAAEELLKRRQARKSLISFCAYTLPYSNPKHQILLASKLEAVERGEIKNLMVFMPPRHLKSETCSIRFPAWCLGRDPQRQFISCSHTESLQYTFSYAVRETILSDCYQRLWRMSLDKAGAVRWQISGKCNMRDSYIAAGVGGGITGEGADFLIIDDPIKNAEEANSETVRESIWQWYITTAVTRLQPEGAKILIMTRWHEDDLAGRLLRIAANDPKADQWDVLHLRAVAIEGEDDPMGRQPGEALWPERYPIEFLDRAKAGSVENVDEPGLGSHAFEALYQGKPTAMVGNMIHRDWWKFYDMAPQLDIVGQYWDTAFTKNADSDYSACVTMGKNTTGIYLLDVWHGRVEFPELCVIVAARYHQFSPARTMVEEAASGRDLIPQLSKQSDVPLLPLKPFSSKVNRTQQITALIESGRVHLPKRAPWVSEFIDECSSFPVGRHDDMVDAMTYGLLDLWKVTSFDAWKKKINQVQESRLQQAGQLSSAGLSFPQPGSSIGG